MFLQAIGLVGSLELPLGVPMSDRILQIAWTVTGQKPHLPDPDREGLSWCGRPVTSPNRRRVSLSDSDPVGGLCRKCEPALGADNE